MFHPGSNLFMLFIVRLSKQTKARKMEVGRVKKLLTLILSVALAYGVAGSAFADSAETDLFPDIKGHWARSTINRLSADGILDGFPDGTFKPDEIVTVDQFLKILLLSFSQKDANGNRSWHPDFVRSLSTASQNLLAWKYEKFDFKPSATGYWAKPFVDIATDLNLLSFDKFFNFEDKLRREDVANIVYYTIKATEPLDDEKDTNQILNEIEDASAAKPSEQKYIAEAYAKGIMDGYPDGRFGVGQFVTRAESLTIVDRIVHKYNRAPSRIKPDGDYSRVIPMGDGSSQKVTFPDKKMYDAYDVLRNAGKSRGDDYDLSGLTLRLFENADAKANALSGRMKGPELPWEEVSFTLVPENRTYGIAIYRSEGVLDRNKEALRMLAGHLFSYNGALKFNEELQNVYNKLANKDTVSDFTVAIDDYHVSVNVRSNGAAILITVAP